LAAQVEQIPAVVVVHQHIIFNMAARAARAS
jgi:hypothetical protein